MKKEIYICDKCGEESVSKFGFIDVDIVWKPKAPRPDWKPEKSYEGHLCSDCAEKLFGW